MDAAATTSRADFGRLNPDWGCSMWDALYLYAIARQALSPEDAQPWTAWACRPVLRAEIDREQLLMSATALLGRPFRDTVEECRDLLEKLEERYDQSRTSHPVIPSSLFSLVRQANFSL